MATEYVKFFDFHNESITDSLRKFLRSFHLIGETQERERILIPFSKRYHQCNDLNYQSEGNDRTRMTGFVVLVLKDTLNQLTKEYF